MIRRMLAAVTAALCCLLFDASTSSHAAPSPGAALSEYTCDSAVPSAPVSLARSGRAPSVVGSAHRAHHAAERWSDGMASRSGSSSAPAATGYMRTAPGANVGQAMTTTCRAARLPVAPVVLGGG